MHGTGWYALYRQQQQNNPIEETATLCFFYLAQVYGQLHDSAQSAFYCQLTLERQIRRYVSIEGSQQPPQIPSPEAFEWIDHSRTLATYYLNELNFRPALDCLFACLWVKDHIVEELPMSEEKEELIEAECCQSLGQLYLMILQEASTKYLMIRDNVSTPRKELPPQQLFRSTIDLPPPTEVHTLEPTSFVEARDVFNASMRYYAKARAYFHLDGHVTNHMEIRQQQSHLYQHLATFERKTSRAFAMHLRRYQLLEKHVLELNAEIYIRLRKECSFELGEICLRLVEFSTTKEKVVTEYLQESTRWFEVFLQTFPSLAWDRGDSDTGPSREEYRPICLAHFHIARNWYRLGDDENLQAKRKSVEWYRRTLEVYQKMQDTIEQDDEEWKDFEVEAKIAQEMLELLPARIEQLEAQQSSRYRKDL